MVVIAGQEISTNSFKNEIAKKLFTRKSFIYIH